MGDLQPQRNADQRQRDGKRKQPVPHRNMRFGGEILQPGKQQLEECRIHANTGAALAMKPSTVPLPCAVL